MEHPVMKSFRFLLPFVLLAAAIPALAQPAAPAPASRMVLTMTRPMHIFSEREGMLADALRKTDHASIDRLLAQDFELREGSAPVQPVPRAQWIDTHPGFAADQMAVHDYGDVAVVSFVNTAAGAKSKNATFVVDVWQKQGEDWRLAVRYQSQLGTRKAATGDIKPSGKN
jgi:hypothetical protein